MNLEDITLIAGTHSDIRDTKKGCVLNVISMLSGAEVIDDEPTCVSPVLQFFARWFNDTCPSLERRNSTLKPLIPLLMESADPALDKERLKVILEKYPGVSNSCYHISWYSALKYFVRPDTGLTKANISYLLRPLSNLVSYDTSNSYLRLLDCQVRASSYSVGSRPCNREKEILDLLRSLCFVGLTELDISERETNFTEVCGKYSLHKV
jgi:hypothetical protein